MDYMDGASKDKGFGHPYKKKKLDCMDGARAGRKDFSLNGY